MQGCNECGSTTHKSALSFACPEHKCTNCEGTLEPKGHNRNDCPRMQTTMCEECGETGHSANKCPIRPCNACGLRSHKLQTSHLCPEHVCTLCNGDEEPKGHNHNICPRAECQTCKLFGHVAKDCVYANCLDVDVDWFNLLFTKSENTVHAYFAEVSVHPISLRTDGIVRTVANWDLLQDKFTLSANQLMEIKLASYSFKCDANRKYDQTVRRLNKPSESPIHFAFTTDYDDDSVPKCPHCRTYLFPQEVSKAMWCCKKGQMLSLYKPWTQPTDEYRSHCIGNFPNAKLFRLHSRALNLTFSFAAFGIKYGAVDQSFAPPYFMKVNGMPYWRMLFANNASEPPANPLHMYIYDSDYHIKDNPLPQQLRDVVKRCMLQTNDLAKKLRNLANEHNVEEISLHIDCDSNTARAPSDVAALMVKPNGTAKHSPRTLIIYPHQNGFAKDFPGLDFRWH